MQEQTLHAIDSNSDVSAKMPFQLKHVKHLHVQGLHQSHKDVNIVQTMEQPDDFETSIHVLAYREYISPSVAHPRMLRIVQVSPA